jgi:hypothetical protein
MTRKQQQTKQKTPSPKIRNLGFIKMNTSIKHVQANNIKTLTLTIGD